MNLLVKHAFLEVDDHDAALAFYRDALGLEVRQDVAMEDARWLTVGPASQPELGIVLCTVAGMMNLVVMVDAYTIAERATFPLPAPAGEPRP